MIKLATCALLLSGSLSVSALATVEVSRPRIITKSATPISTAVTTGLIQYYRVGVGDVLDIELPDSPNAKSSLFTVLEGCMIDYPLASHPIRVAGLTAGEISALLREQIKSVDKPTVVVKVHNNVQ